MDLDLNYNYLNRKNNNVLEKKIKDKENIIKKIGSDIKTKLENIENDILKDKIINGLFKVFAVLIILSFLLYIFLEGEKPGWLVIKNNYVVYGLTILPMVLLGFSNNYFHYYIQKNIEQYLNKFIQNSSFIKIYDVNSTAENKIDYQSILMIESILFTTLILAISMLFSRLTKLILEKGIINYNENDNISKNNLLFNFIGIIIGGIVYMIYYFLFQKNKVFIKDDILQDVS